MNRVLTIILCLPGLIFASNRQEAAPKTNIPRFQMLADGIYRGGQPDLKGFEFLKQQGIRTIINLREDNHGEKAIVEKLGMKSVHIPVTVTPFAPGSKIPLSAIAKYFEVLNNPENYPIFFHCRRGADRTGAMAGFYRIIHQGWEGRKAYSEARDVGMRWWYPGLKGQLQDFKTTWTKQATATAGSK
jgi:tyrosine-protein phosphatase SIW14